MGKANGTIDVKKAVKIAMSYAQDVYAEEDIVNLGLEEVNFDDNAWWITVGFSRPWSNDRPMEPTSVSFVVPPMHVTDRDYKVVQIEADSGEVVGMKIREL